jgi:hypothetical protein
MLKIHKNITTLKIALGLTMAISLGHANALESFYGKVTTLEPSYLPNRVAFVMDTGNSTCPAGTWLIWVNADASNNKAVYATLLAAISAGKRVKFHINDGDTTCTGRHLHLLPD